MSLALREICPTRLVALFRLSRLCGNFSRFSSYKTIAEILYLSIVFVSSVGILSMQNNLLWHLDATTDIDVLAYEKCTFSACLTLDAGQTGSHRSLFGSILFHVHRTVYRIVYWYAITTRHFYGSREKIDRFKNVIFFRNSVFLVSLLNRTLRFENRSVLIGTSINCEYNKNQSLLNIYVVPFARCCVLVKYAHTYIDNRIDCSIINGNSFELVNERNPLVVTTTTVYIQWISYDFRPTGASR